MTAPTPATVRDLATHISDEFVNAAGVGNSRVGSRAARAVIWLPARRVARFLAEFDADVAAEDLPAASKQLVTRLVSGWETQGAERLPRDGPLLILANHPGAFDGFLALSSLPRQDIKVALSDSAVFRGLPAVSPHLIFISPDPVQRSDAARRMIRHLRSGGALYTYPAGLPEPDPDVLPGAEAGFDRWSPSVELLIRSAPETRIVIVILSGVLSASCLNYPVVRSQTVDWQRQRLAEYAQVAQQVMFGRRFGLRPRVSYSEPFRAADLGDEGVMPGILARARRLLAEHVAGRT